MTKSDDETPIDPESLRRPWTEGPDEEAPEESWLSLGDDELLHRVETLSSDENFDDRLIEIVQSNRHFFIRQEAAKRVRDRSRLFPFEDDRHIGQILVRYLTRREDVTYLERLVSSSRHTEVRAAAQVQLAQLWGRLGGPTSGTEGEAPPPPVFEEAGPPPELRRSMSPPGLEAEPDDEIEIDVESVDAFATGREGATGELVTTDGASTGEPVTKPAPATGDQPAPAEAAPESPRSSVAEAASAAAFANGPAPGVTAAPEPEATSAEAVAVEQMEAAEAPAGGGTAAGEAQEGVDGSLLGWAIHFLVEQVWSHLDTRTARGLLLRTHAELLPSHPVLSFFRVEEDAHVHVDLTGGARLPREAVPGVAAWMAAFLAATRSTSPDLEQVDVRESTRLMDDALEQAGFYEAFRSFEEA